MGSDEVVVSRHPMAAEADRIEAEGPTLRDAVEALYFAAHWSPDRPVDAAGLWTRVRDAAGIAPGQTLARLGPPRA